MREIDEEMHGQKGSPNKTYTGTSSPRPRGRHAPSGPAEMDVFLCYLSQV